jgi:muramoyltetrapeptide carboxypeptidase
MKPKSLRPGETIGIFSSSSPTTEEAVTRLRKYFEMRGYRTKVAPHTLLASGYMAGEPRQRAADINMLFTDDEVSLLMTATGGASAIQMLPHVDYEAIAKHPKILAGLSDPTCLLNAITAGTGLPTFHGPNGYNFGHKSPTAFTEAN